MHPRPPGARPLLPFLLLLFVSLLIQPVTAHFYSSTRKQELRELARGTWVHAYSTYKRVAFPADELLPLTCGKQGHDRRNPENTGVNDVMGDYALTLVDSFDTFAMLNDRPAFEQAVRDVIQHVSFDVDSRVQVFEITIRMMGGLLSGHLLARPPPSPSSSSSDSPYSSYASPIKGFSLPWYNNELLHLAHDLGRRLLPAFETPTGMPFARVHLQKGLRNGKGKGESGRGESGETCSAGAGSLLLEFITLSRLTSDPLFESVARRAFFAVWNSRSEIGLIGNTIDVRSGGWMHGVSSTGAGVDSFFEYAAKAYVLTGEEEYRRVWDEAYAALQRYVLSPDGFWYRGVNMHTGQLSTTLVDSLSAFFPGVQVLMGDLESAIKGHAVYAFQWRRYGGLPELFETQKRVAANLGYPLRPEFVESNLYLYQATKDDYYLSIAEQILHDLNNLTRTDCGFAAVLNLETRELENKMPSFFLSETLKYLFLTFDEHNPFLTDDSAFVFTTEGHPLSIPHPPRPSAPSQRPNRNSKKRGYVPPSPASSSSSSATANEKPAPTCAAHDPVSDEYDHYFHFLSLGVEKRTDWEVARWNAGYEILDGIEGEGGEEGWRRETREGRWSENGWCEVPLGLENSPVIIPSSSRASASLAALQQYVLAYLANNPSPPPADAISSLMIAALHSPSSSPSSSPSPPPLPRPSTTSAAFPSLFASSSIPSIDSDDLRTSTSSSSSPLPPLPRSSPPPPLSSPSPALPTLIATTTSTCTRSPGCDSPSLVTLHPARPTPTLTLREGEQGSS